ncbi:MAG: response regulator, partial [archaeon]|nr:response regulator [archaeon]
ASFKAKALTKQLLTFSKGGAPIKSAANIEKIITDSANFVLRGSNVKCTFLFDNDLMTVEVDEGQMNQVMNNLIINADQAMPNGGILTIIVKNFIISKPLALPIKSGNYIKIEIIDQGIGIPKEYISKIFDPYFSTKQTGSGLGLATTYSIVKNHNGFITVDSILGKGTTFIVYLPAIKINLNDKMDESTVKTKKSLKISTNSQKSRGTILLLDDEKTIQKVAKKMIEKLGFNVLSAMDGKEAIEIYKNSLENEPKIDFLIIDLTIPGGIGGKETLTEIKKLNPNIKAIVSSGYSTDPIMANYKDYGFSGVISKPYTIEQLSNILDSHFPSN